MTRANKLKDLMIRYDYMIEIRGGISPSYINGVQEKFQAVEDGWSNYKGYVIDRYLSELEETISKAEEQMSEEPLTPMDLVRISRSPQRISLFDILFHCYNEFEIVSGDYLEDPDPAVVVARAIIQRPRGKTMTSDRVMVIGHESGHGQQERRGGATNPFGNNKIAAHIRIAEEEEIPVHLWANTPGALPFEEYPGAAQMISECIRTAVSAKTPIVVVNYGQGGSGGFVAAGVGDKRYMTSYSWFSAISPEGAAAIEAFNIPQAERTEKKIKELTELVAREMRISAEECLRSGLIDGIIKEPLLGARIKDIDFFKRARYQVINATDEVVLEVKSLRSLRNYQKVQRSYEETNGRIHNYVRWNLSEKEKEQLVKRRRGRIRELSLGFFSDERKPEDIRTEKRRELWRMLINTAYHFHYRRSKTRLNGVKSEIIDEVRTFLKTMNPYKKISGAFSQKFKTGNNIISNIQRLEEKYPFDKEYISPLVHEDRTEKCLQRKKYGCLDMWVPELYNDYAGICPNCGYHFEMEWQYLLAKWFNKGSVRIFNQGIREINVLNYPGLDQKLERDRRKSGQKSSVLSFEAKLYDLYLVAVLIIGDFRGGSIGAGSSEKICQAIEKALRQKMPFVFITHKTVGIRTQEGAVGLIAMEQVSSVLAEYTEKGGFPVSIFAGPTFAGPYASFLSMPHHIYALPSIRIGFAGPDVIYRTTKEKMPPDYHDVTKAKERGHITGIWRRDMVRRNLYRVLLHGGKHLYYS